MPRRKLYPARVETALTREDAAWLLLESRARKVTISEFLRFLVTHYRAFSPAAQRDLFAGLDEDAS